MRLRLALLAAASSLSRPRSPPMWRSRPPWSPTESRPSRASWPTRPGPIWNSGPRRFRAGIRRTRGIAITTRFGNVAQVHEVAVPMGMRRQMSFEADTIAGASYARGKGDVLVVQKDVGGSEFWQLYTARERPAEAVHRRQEPQQHECLEPGRALARLHVHAPQRTDNDIYIDRSARPGEQPAARPGRGRRLGPADFAPDGQRAVVANYISVNKTTSTGSTSPAAGWLRSATMRRRSIMAAASSRPTADCGSARTKARTSFASERSIPPPAASHP